MTSAQGNGSGRSASTEAQPSVRGGSGWVNELYAESQLLQGHRMRVQRHHMAALRRTTRNLLWGGVATRQGRPNARHPDLYDDDKCSPASTILALPSVRSSRTIWPWRPPEASAPESWGPSSKHAGGPWRRLPERPDHVQVRSATQVAEGLHLRLPSKPPVRDELVAKVGARVAFTTTSIGMVDQQGRRPIERGLSGVLPAGWQGPCLE